MQWNDTVLYLFWAIIPCGLHITLFSIFLHSEKYDAAVLKTHCTLWREPLIPVSSVRGLLGTIYISIIRHCYGSYFAFLCDVRIHLNLFLKYHSPPLIILPHTALICLFNFYIHKHNKPEQVQIHYRMLNVVKIDRITGYSYILFFYIHSVIWVCFVFLFSRKHLHFPTHLVIPQCKN